MPLKHFTETFLLIVLGAVVALTGLLMSTLPNLPSGALPWALLFVLSIIYPLSLYSLFQRRRADNTFRNLHWFPALMLLVWVLLQGATFGSSLTTEDVEIFTWGWSMGAVLVGFVAIVMFCLRVIRRRLPRLLLLAAILVPFAAVAFLSASGGQYEKELAATLWSADFWEIEQVAKNLDPSEDPKEEEWRERLRAQERRQERIAETKTQRSSVRSSSSSSRSSEEMMIGSTSSMPTKLPDSGLGWTFIISLMVIAYSAVLHKRALARA